MADGGRFYPRHAGTALELSLKEARVVLVNGPRQCGKTTLARMACEASGGRYESLDNLSTRRRALESPAGFIEGTGLLVIDEFQKGGEGLLLAVKAEVDRHPSPGRFLLTGSTRFLTLPTISESLAGRVDIIDLWPLSQGELRGRREAFADLLFGTARALRSIRPPALPRASYYEAACRGGFPPVQARSAAGRRRWFSSYVDTVTQKDVQEISRVRQARDLKRLIRYLAANTAGELHVASLARDLDLPRTTVDGYLPLLETLYLFVRLPGWSRNLTSKVVKHAKAHLVDSGLAGHLLNIDPGSMSGPASPAAGRLLETFVAGELLRQRTWASTPFELHHFRDRDGKEVDFVLEASDGRVAAVEVKASSSPGERDVRSLEWLRDRLGESFVQGVLLYTGEAVLSFGDRVTLMPVSALWAG